MNRKLIRFDWAMKKMLRHKANFGILEGFLSELLRFDITIESILESEGNKQDEYESPPAPERGESMLILIKNNKNELNIIEIRIIPPSGVRGLLRLGEPYGTIKKIYSINIVYFGLGQGKDYVYEYKGEFVGLHENDILLPTSLQKQDFKVEKISDIFPKYYLLKVNNFNDVAKDTLDEWVYFLKNSEVKDGFKAKGLDKAKEKLQYEILTEEEKKMYNRFQENRRIEISVEYTAKAEAKQEKAIEMARKAIKRGFDNETITDLTDLTIEQIEQLRNENMPN